jgi:AcrR family transcriptional regulator
LPKPAKQARSLATQEAVLQAAAAKFSAQAYDNVSLNDVIEGVDVTQGALYYHFPNKHEIALELIRRQHALSFANSERYLSAGLPALAGLVQLSGRFAGQITDNPIVRAGLRLSTESAASLPELASQPYRDWLDACETYTFKAYFDNQLRPGLTAKAAASTVVEAITGVQTVSGILSGWRDLSDRMVRMWEVLLPGLAAPGLVDELAGDVPALIQAGWDDRND